MFFIRLLLLLSAAHLFLVIVTFILFGLGLEGDRNPGHDLLWILLQPGVAFPGPVFLTLPLTSLLWGFAGAVLLTVCRSCTKR